MWKMCNVWYFMSVSASPAAMPGISVLCTVPHIIHPQSTLHTSPLILLQLRVLLLNAVLRDDEHLQTVTDLDMPLCRAREGV
jgi:hypothetical protein